ncbi:MAG TPA: dsDNA nuclease domain-containing protein [Prolixibacteraceae bacterium]|jgi:hypothetical protein
MSGNSGSLNEIINVANRKDLSESGGPQMYRGGDFERYWAIVHMFDLEDKGDDFLFLFESIQDIVVLDSTIDPKCIRIYQVKKNERGRWSWGELTALPDPNRRKKSSKEQTLSHEKLKKSIIGKLYASVIAFKTLSCEGFFISNTGCDLPLADGQNAATSLHCSLSGLSESHFALLTSGLATIYQNDPRPNLSKIKVSRVKLSPDDLETHVTGVIFNYLHKHHPDHSGQTKCLVESLFSKVSRLTRKTEFCPSFDEMRQERGFSRDEFRRDLAQVVELPDIHRWLQLMTNQLASEGMPLEDVIGIESATVAIYRRALSGIQDKGAKHIIQNCDDWIKDNLRQHKLLDNFESAFDFLQRKHPTLRRNELLAHFALRMIFNART